MIRITIYAGPHPDDELLTSSYKPTVSVMEVRDGDVSEELRKLGLEWRQADYFPNRQTVITLDPLPEAKQQDVEGLVRKAAELLEETGML